MENVAAISEQIRDMGFQTFSANDYIDSYKEQMRTVQAVLGAIGAVALLVAAIGIMNTMMMSIYERTKEIGVIKVLGCKMSNIMRMFLTESAYIGIFGGITGLGFSYLLSFILTGF
jgi:ABC-type antimicrobial peptide transport system permease subunit